MSLFVLRFLMAVGEALTIFGAPWVPLPADPPAEPALPGPGHPERLCPWVPPTEQERAIWDDVRG
ncbi:MULTISPECIES: DUF6059 family protein [unclassified Streptomyces]|uniref:DUF6059 family protein n=1 Tax=unclassified Streptomyces TaxID=2593676 RepID=UPI000313E920|nr:MULTISPECIES: DUF6059 family protein [unclassified Streptomyces]MYS40773.1 hypothetical protein [Streptomyces sp. SID5998]MYX39944.1 hypothetical protein [Streptomyces sp. SID89]MYX30297.1 hypothetical protein [Streptomyces sp. SID8381]NED36257.1 hypothetical protein [Streptomyces sp. SID8499]NMO33619.1 hypothetical protein [Streptomyces sp. GMY02]